MNTQSKVDRTAPRPVSPAAPGQASTLAHFDWTAARAALDGLPGGRGLNIAHEAVDRHARGPRRDHVAIRWLGKNGARQSFTYGDLALLSNRFANVLQTLGVRPGERVFSLGACRAHL